jgi:hypothetical protein
MLDLMLVNPIPFAMSIVAATFILAEARVASRAARSFGFATMAVQRPYHAAGRHHR